MTTLHRLYYRESNLRRPLPAFAFLMLLMLLLMPVTVFADEVLLSEDAAADLLLQRLKAIARPMFEEVPIFCYRIKATLQTPAELNEPRVEDSSPESRQASLTLFRNENSECGMILTSPWKNVAIHWTASKTALILPDAHVSFVGRGDLPPDCDSLSPAGFVARFITPATSLYSFLAMMNENSFDFAFRQLLLPRLTLLAAGHGGDGEITYQLSNGLKVAFLKSATPAISIEADEGVRDIARLKYFEISFATDTVDVFPASSTTDAAMSETEVSRADLEKMIFRGLKRILSIKLPGVHTGLEARKTANGELRHHQGQTLVMLAGSPEQMGNAHATLLQPWMRLLIDSTVYLVGLVETIKKARWFLADLEDAWTRVSPHVPERYHREMEAMASACTDISLREVRLSNVFPEYFHCSGFALFGSATADGMLYHGRVLDYMTEIGLQDCAVAFVIKPQEGRAFFNPGFAGFAGAVGGMNERQVSVGEMGGRGRFLWDGVPMSFLVRRALEECDSLQQVKDLWANNPRTCEYFYVFADAKIPDAVGLHATPDLLTFLGAGESHEFLGDGIPDTVVMSAGNRLRHLRRLVQEGHGSFVATSSLRLMDRPVAMRSNLHNILFIPARQQAYVAIASPFAPAAEQQYVFYDIKQLLSEFP